MSRLFLHFARLAAMSALITGLGFRTAKADVTPVSSTLTLTAQADATQGGAGGQTQTNSQSQGATVNPLNASVDVTDLSPTDSSIWVRTVGTGDATWVDPSHGSVHFSNNGWTSANVLAGAANLYNTQFSYNFLANTSGSFAIDYTIAVSSSNTDSFGLNGFYFSFTGGSTNDSRQLLNPGWQSNIYVPSFSGTIVETLSAGTTYALTITSASNISGGLATRTASMDGLFNFGSTGLVVPEPSSLLSAGLSSLLCAGYAWGRLKRRSS